MLRNTILQIRSCRGLMQDRSERCSNTSCFVQKDHVIPRAPGPMLHSCLVARGLKREDWFVPVSLFLIFASFPVVLTTHGSSELQECKLPFFLVQLGSVCGVACGVCCWGVPIPHQTRRRTPVRDPSLGQNGVQHLLGLIGWTRLGGVGEPHVVLGGGDGSPARPAPKVL